MPIVQTALKQQLAPRRPGLAPQRAYTKFKLMVVVGCLLLLGAAYIFAPQKPHSVAAHSQNQTATFNYSAMDNTIPNLISANPNIDISVAYINLQSGTTRHYGLNDVFVAASTAKVLTATAFLHQVEQGNASLSDPIGNSSAAKQLDAMVSQSDNQAWEDFNTSLGHPQLQAYASSIGLTSYNAESNTMTASDLALLFQKLYQGHLLNSADTRLVLGYMKHANEADYIPPAVPSSFTVYHKAGVLDDRLHDAAIIDNGTSPYVLVIFTNGHGTFETDQRTQLIQAITKATLPR